ncbi:DUF2771 domain-containing protein [Streptomyces sp. NPDC059740]|uniref:DUF2771 domain-containing protein n=1 Tax=Streptomyces sp. NPDC059740 TaxID=3346926 RepID=UPI003648E79F
MDEALRPSRTTPRRSAWSRGRRAGAALGAVSLGLVALSSCSQPTPLATVTVGSGTVTAEASCYQDGKSLGEFSGQNKENIAKFSTCLNAKPKKTITVHPGEKVRLGVEPETADQGWFAAVNGNQQLSSVSKQTYASFDGEQLFYSQQGGGPSDSATVSIISSKGSAFTGVWNVKLKRADS